MTKNQRVISKKMKHILKDLLKTVMLDSIWFVQQWIIVILNTYENSNCIQIVLYQIWYLLGDGTLQVIKTYWLMRPNVICVADWVKVSFMQKFGHISNLYLWLTFNSALTAISIRVWFSKISKVDSFLSSFRLITSSSVAKLK